MNDARAAGTTRPDPGPEPGWLEALNPPIYLISILPAVGILLTAGHSPAVLNALLPATLAVVLLQHGINLLNDVSDWRLGADVEKHDSWVRYHGLRPRVAALHGALSLAAGGILGLAVLLLFERLWILAFATPLVALGYLYNAGRRPLSYTRLGEWVTGLCYGPGVYGCLWLLSGRAVDVGAVFGMAAFAALAMALLLSHQPPQVDTDRAAGKNSFAVRYGVTTTQRSANGLYLVFVACFGLALWSQGSSLLVTTGFVAIGAAGVIAIGTPSPRLILKFSSLALILALALALILQLSGAAPWPAPA